MRRNEQDALVFEGDVAFLQFFGLATMGIINTESRDTLLKLVCIGISNTSKNAFPFGIDWSEIEVFAKRQGLWGILYDAVEQMPQTDRPPQLMWLRWIGEIMQGYERQYQLYEKSVASLSAFYNAHGYRMMLLKGLACGIDWPRPEHRPYGDIDVWLFGQQGEADVTLTRNLGIKVDNSHHHHTVFQWHGFTVENHYDFINVHHQKSNAKLEKIFKERGADDSLYVEICGEKVYLPSPNLHALFLIKHLASHFAADRITIRHLLDWAFFVENHGNEVDWYWMFEKLKSFGMMKMFDVVNAICVEDLGFRNGCWSRFDGSGVDANIKQRVLNDIFSPEFSDKVPKHVWNRIPFKYRRWKANEWKHELCYNESMSSSFWSGVKNHLLKPSTL